MFAKVEEPRASLVIANEIFLRTAASILPHLRSTRGGIRTHPSPDLLELGACELRRRSQHLTVGLGPIPGTSSKARRRPTCRSSRHESGMVINPKPAKALRLDVPPSLLLRAGEVIGWSTNDRLWQGVSVRGGASGGALVLIKQTGPLTEFRQTSAFLNCDGVRDAGFLNRGATVQPTLRELLPSASYAVTTPACLDGNRSQSTTATSKSAGTSPNR